jgi:hypothetical protein
MQAALGINAAPAAAAGARQGARRLRSPRLDDTSHEQLAELEARGGAREGFPQSASAVAGTFLKSNAREGADAHSDETGIKNMPPDYECPALPSEHTATSGSVMQLLACCRAS